MEPVLTERRGSVVVVTLNMPAKHNALSAELYPALAATLGALQDDPDARAIVVTGGRNFCAGGDLDGLDLSGLEMRGNMQLGQRIVRALAAGRLPTVAAVEGGAYGAGFSIAMACDFVVSDESSTFCAAFGRVGLVPDYGLLWTLPQRVGIGTAREIMMLCEPIRGGAAKALGLVDRLAAPGEVLSTAVALAERLAMTAPATIAGTKAVLSRMPLSLDVVLAWEADTQSLYVQSEDLQEGIRAFREKRPPKFGGR